MRKLEARNGFCFLKGNYIDDIENDVVDGVGLHLINCEIEDYDADGVYFSTNGYNSEVYFQELNGERIYLLKEGEYEKF